MAAETTEPRSVVIVGGGVAGLEATLALTHLAGDAVSLRLIDAEPDFTYKALSIEEPFSGRPADRRDLGSAMEALGGEFTLGRVTDFDLDGHTVEVDGSERIPYDVLAVCLGARSVPALGEPVETLRPDRAELPVDRLIETAHGSGSNAIALVAPTVASYALPLYELALMLRSRSEELGHPDLGVVVYSPEPRPLDAFGKTPSGAVAELLDTRRIEFRGSTSVVEGEGEGGNLRVMPGGQPLDAGAVIALPALVGPAIAGLPGDADGFIPVDGFGRVRGAEDVYAAGDGTDFPVKQGGLAAQQADVLAAHVAASLGAPIEPQPFTGVLRAQLLTGGESLFMVHELGGDGEGIVSEDCLWSPPEKVAGRYLTAWLRNVRVPDWGSDEELTGGEAWGPAGTNPLTQSPQLGPSSGD